MIDMLKRHEIQVLRRAGHAQTDGAKLAGVSLGSVRRVGREATDRSQGEDRLPDGHRKLGHIDFGPVHICLPD